MLACFLKQFKLLRLLIYQHNVRAFLSERFLEWSIMVQSRMSERFHTNRVSSQKFEIYFLLCTFKIVTICVFLITMWWFDAHWIVIWQETCSVGQFQTGSRAEITASMFSFLTSTLNLHDIFVHLYYFIWDCRSIFS